MKNNKKPTGAEYYDNYYDSYFQKQYYFNGTREQDLPPFSKNQAFDPNYNCNYKGKSKRQDPRNPNSKRNNENFFERKNNENYCNTLHSKSNNNFQTNETVNFNTNKNHNNLIHFNNNKNDNSTGKVFKNNQTSQNQHEDQAFQNQNYYKYQNNHNNNQYNKGFHNKRNYQKNNSDNYLNIQEKQSVDKLVTEIPEAYIHPSDKRLDIKNECNYEVTDGTNSKINNKKVEFNYNSEPKCELNFAINNEKNLKDNVSVNSSTQVDSYNSVEDKIALKNSDQSILNEKNYIEDNTKTNTSSNTPISASPVIACHKKSINSIKNEIKLNDSRDNNDKSLENSDTANLNIQQRKEEPKFLMNESEKFNTLQLKEDESSILINEFKVNGLNNNLNPQSKPNSNFNIRSANNNLINSLKFDENNHRAIINKNSSNINKNSELFYKNKFSQNLNNAINPNYIHVASIPEPHSQANQRHPNYNSNYNKNNLFHFNQPPPQQFLPPFQNPSPNLFLQNNIPFANQDQFQPIPQFRNRNFELMNSIKLPSNNPIYSNNSFNNNKKHNGDFIRNNNNHIPVPHNYQTDFSSFPAFNRSVHNNNNNLFINNENNHNKNNINSSNNFFIDNFQRPIPNNTNNYIDSDKYQRPFILNTNFPQKNTCDNKTIDSIQNPAGQIVNNYFNYLFNDTNANISMFATEMKPEAKLAPKINPNFQNSFVNNNDNKNEILPQDNKETKEMVKISNTITEELDNVFIKKSNTFQKTEENQNLTPIAKSIPDPIPIINIKQNHNNPKDIREKASLVLKEQEFDEKLKNNKFLKSTQNKNSEHKNYANSNDKHSTSTKTANSGSDLNENVEILKVVLLSVPGVDSKDSNLTFTVHKHDNLFESFSSFLTLNKISLEFEFPILVNIFQAISAIYNLSNSKISKSDEQSIKILHSIWKNHCFLVSQKTLFNKNNNNSFIKKNLENELDKMLNLNANKGSDLSEHPNDININSNFKTEKNLIESIGVYNSSLLCEDSIDQIEEDPELNDSRSFSFKGEYECIDRMHFMNNMSLLNKSF